jgi:hypothetical protein
MSTILTDELATKDLLGRKQFAKHITTSLLTSFDKVEESIVVGICGRWGSGKSTLLSYLDDCIKDYFSNDSERFRIINFNSWEVIGLDDLQINLIAKIVSELEAVNWKTKLRDTNATVKKNLEWLPKWIRPFEDVPLAKGFVKTIATYLEEPTKKSLDEIKKKARSLIKEKEIKIFVLIDDIDRLTPQEITTVFKVIKLNANFLNTIFIVAYDKEVVINALNHQFSENGESYLEKIIQVDFVIPEILGEQLEEVFFDKMKLLSEKYNFAKEQQAIYNAWRYRGLKEYFTTIRDVKRFFNSLLFSLPNIFNDVNIVDFILLEAIKVFDYNAYEKLYSEFLIIQRQAIWHSIFFDDQTIDAYNSLTTRNILKYLFTSNHNFNSRDNSPNAKHLKDPEIFPRYFTLYINSKDVSEEAISRFFMAGTNRSNILTEVLQNGKMENFLRRLSDPELRKFYQIDSPTIFNSFIDFWDKNDESITSSLDQLIWDSFFNMAHSFKNDFEGANEAISVLFLHISSVTSAKFIFNYFILKFQDENEGGSQIKGAVKHKIDICIPELEANFIEYIKRNFSHYLWHTDIGKEKFVTNLFLYSFAKFCPEEYKKEILRYYLHRPAFLAFIVKSYFVAIDTLSKKPGRIYLDKKDILLPNELYSEFLLALKNIKQGALSAENTEYVKYFLDAVSPDS